MNRSGLAGIMLAVAAGLAMPAMGQLRVGGDGHATDANTQVGSGGYNAAEAAPLVTPNDITYGNVTGGFQFRGRLPTAFTDPSGFSQPLPGEQLDAFDRESPGVPTLDHPSVTANYTGPHAFYSRTDSPTIPEGFVPSNAASGNFLAAAPPTQQDLSVDLRLGAPMDFNAPLPKPGDLMIPGQVDTMAQANPTNPTPPVYFMASPLYGVRQLSPDQNSPDNTNPQSASGQTGTGFTPFGTLGQPNLRQQQIQKMQQELSQSVKGQGQSSSSSSANLSPSALAPLTPGNMNPNNPTQQNPNQPLSQLAVGATPVAPTVMTPTAGDMSTSPLGSPDVQALLPAPADQSTQIATLQQRMSAYNKAHPASEDQTNQDFLTNLQKREGALSPAGQNPAGQTPGAENPSGAGGPESTTVLPTPTGIAVAPPMVAPSSAASDADADQKFVRRDRIEEPCGPAEEIGRSDAHRGICQVDRRIRRSFRGCAEQCADSAGARQCGARRFVLQPG